MGRIIRTSEEFVEKEKIIGSKQEQEVEYYTVKDNDSLAKIAEKYNTTWQKLMVLNDIKNPNNVYPGERLRVK